MPGSPLDPRCHGTNDLLKQGAIVTTSTADVLEGLAPLSRDDLFSRLSAREPAPEHAPAAPPAMVSPGEGGRALVIEALGPTPVEIDDIIRHTGLSASEVHLVLLELDLTGQLSRHGGNLVSLAPPQ
ncbi:DNA processing protein DprA [Sinorhizobium americanum]|uniref:DNA processing protein DprA n=1 Tax=Sinorhizobium americanum TaxID=194963 RepID=A0A1L3LKY2_9HYPH|nr:DNA processing protein DprA [Sinorhizobium americanum]